jgi:NAD(P)-dependent dehydrogenase (short-subunit alcohol dehydrogenase family)
VFESAVDVTKKSQVHDLIDKAKAKFGTVDILINNAGIIRDGFLANLSEEDWDQVLDVNLKGAFLCCQAVFPVMKEQQAGSIVNITSRAWLGNVGQANYSASKGGLVSLTRTLALEFARYQINVNAVAPGLIDTPMTRGMPEKARERLLKMQPTGKMGTVDDIAAAVSFLASSDARYITGQVLHVDGGKSCGLLSL